MIKIEGIAKSSMVNILFFLKKSGNAKNTVSKIGTYTKRPAPGLNNKPKTPAPKDPYAPDCPKLVAMLETSAPMLVVDSTTYRIPSIVLLNSYPKIRGNVNDNTFLIFWIMPDNVQVFWNITVSVKKKKRGIITYITSCLIIKPKTKSIDEIIEYDIF